MTLQGSPFATDYRDARDRFVRALGKFEQQTGQRFARERFTVDRAEDLTIDCAELRPKAPRRLYVVVSGIHGIEGFAGNAIQRALLADVLPGFDLQTTGVLLVHALNPFGMHRLRRVNANNVDLNRNLASPGDALYATDSSGYMLLAKTLAPETSYDGRGLTHALFFAGIARAVARHGYTALREATLAGQYAEPRGVFYGGRELQPETRFFQSRFEAACARYPEILVTDLHTGYGQRGKAFALFGRADTPAFREFTEAGVPDRSGADQRYSVHGDLVGYCHAAAKRARPDGVFNGTVVELGTTGLSPLSQLADLHTVVRENQVHHHGARDPFTADQVRLRFRELFDPRDIDWQHTATFAAVACIEKLLASCGYLPGAAQSG